jgi:predicted nucleotidyltransferase
MISDKVNFQSDEFIALCKSHQVKELYAFGSVVNGNFTDESDIDLIVEIDENNPIFKGKLILSLYSKFEQLFNKKVDLLTLNSLRNSILEEYIGTTRKLIYSSSIANENRQKSKTV